LSFSDLNLDSAIIKALDAAGYTEPTPIQAEAIPEIMAGHDLMGSAQTGTGKTAAFMLPALNLLSEPHPAKSRGPRILVLTPTRELAAQVNDAARKYGKFLRARTISVVGGMPYPLQNKLLSQPVDILVATPGRLMDHMDKGRINLDRLQMLVLDEADRMLDMGFLPDVERITAQLPAERQTLLFSATFDGAIAKIAKNVLTDPKTISVASQQAKHENIEQRLHYVDDMHHKNKLLEHLLIDSEVNQAIIFTSTKRHADVLADDLYAAGHRTASLHGDMTQGARNRTLKKLRHGDVRVLVATDVAARGIDVQGITHVINYDLPKFAEDYVHRIGRTGRAGNKGIAISFAGGSDRHSLRKIEQFTGNKITPEVIKGFEPKKPIGKGDDRPNRKRNHKKSFAKNGKPSYGKPSNGKPSNGKPSSYKSNGKPNNRKAANSNHDKSNANGNQTFDPFDTTVSLTSHEHKFDPTKDNSFSNGKSKNGSANGYAKKGAKPTRGKRSNVKSKSGNGNNGNGNFKPQNANRARKSTNRQPSHFE